MLQPFLYVLLIQVNVLLRQITVYVAIFNQSTVTDSLGHVVSNASRIPFLSVSLKRHSLLSQSSLDSVELLSSSSVISVRHSIRTCVDSLSHISWLFAMGTKLVFYSTAVVFPNGSTFLSA